MSCRRRDKYRRAHARKTANDYALSSRGRRAPRRRPRHTPRSRQYDRWRRLQAPPAPISCQPDSGRERPYQSAAPSERAADGHPYGGQVSGHPLDPLRARRPRLKRIAEILGLAGHLPIEELHDAHGVRRLPVIGQDIFSDPEVARADYPPHCEAFPVRLRRARRADLAPAANALARLRIFEHRVLPVNLVLRLEIVRIGRSPVAIQSRSNLSAFHIKSPSPWPSTFSHFQTGKRRACLT